MTLEEYAELHPYAESITPGNCNTCILFSVEDEWDEMSHMNHPKCNGVEIIKGFACPYRE